MEKKNEKDGKPALPGDIIKVRKHHKQAYKFLSSALELDENEESSSDDSDSDRDDGDMLDCNELPAPEVSDSELDSPQAAAQELIAATTAKRRHINSRISPPNRQLDFDASPYENNDNDFSIPDSPSEPIHSLKIGSHSTDLPFRTPNNNDDNTSEKENETESTMSELSCSPDPSSAEASSDQGNAGQSPESGGRRGRGIRRRGGRVRGRGSRGCRSQSAESQRSKSRSRGCGRPRDPVISDMRKATGLYDKGAHELKEGIGVKLYGSGSEYDRARGLQEKMDGNLKHAESRILDLNLLIEKSLLEKQDGEENDKDSDTKSNHVKPTTSYKTPTYKKTTTGSSSSSKGRTGTKPNGSVPSSFAPKKAPFRPGGIAGASRNPGKSKGPKEPSADQHKKVSNLNNVDSKHANLILNEVIEKGRGVSFEDIGGMENAKQTLHEIVILPALRPELFTGLRAPARGLLLFGPPGNGKTLLAKAVATEANAVFFNISAASLTSKWIGEGEKMVRAMFSVARELQPAIIFIDEIDSLLSERKENENEATRRLKTEFLVGFDGVISESDERILVMGATNRPWELDDAALRRLVKRVHIPLPNYETRKDILKKVLSKHTNVSLDENDMNIIGRKTESYSGSDLTALCREAALMPIRNMSPDQIKSVPADQVRGLILNDLIEAMHTIRASVSGEYLKKFDEWNKKYGCVS